MSFELGQKFLCFLPQLKDELPFSPQLIQKLFLQTKSNSLSSLEEIARTIAKDQALTTKILTQANSAYYGLQGQISSISRAVTILGLKQTRQIILNFGLKVISQKIDPTFFDLVTYWQHQSFIALLAQKLGQMLSYPEPEDLFTMGILHDLGKLITAIYAKDTWKNILKTHKKNRPLVETEQEYWGIDHALIGALTLAHWNFPEWISEPINWHHSPHLVKGNSIKSTAILYLANNAAHIIKNEPHMEIESQLDLLGLNRDQLIDLARQIEQKSSFAHLQSLY
ncbi:HDOD domain-containing protein [Desulfovulcanus sp.]